MTNQEVIDAIFNDPTVKYELTEFQGLGKTIPEMLNIYSRPGTGKLTGKDVYYIKPLCKFHSEKEEFQIYVEGGKSNPEEIVRNFGYGNSSTTTDTRPTKSGAKFRCSLVVPKQLNLPTSPFTAKPTSKQ